MASTEEPDEGQQQHEARAVSLASGEVANRGQALLDKGSKFGGRTSSDRQTQPQQPGAVAASATGAAMASTEEQEEGQQQEPLALSSASGQDANRGQALLDKGSKF